MYGASFPFVLFLKEWRIRKWQRNTKTLHLLPLPLQNRQHSESGCLAGSRAHKSHLFNSPAAVQDPVNSAAVSECPMVFKVGPREGKLGAGP